MHRFTTKETKHQDRKSKAKCLYLLLPLILVGFFYLINSVDQSTIDKQRDSLDIAINKDILHCYAVEGYYPPSLDYLKEHYGLTYDEELFFIDYRPIGSNIRPDVTILINEN